ncbi:MAG: CehA/McbA family metallohydrolase [Gemmataceae bacterium]
MASRSASLLYFLVVLFLAGPSAGAEQPIAPRKPTSDRELRYWLENMTWHHHFSPAEVSAATGLSEDEVRAALDRFKIRPDNQPKRAANAPLLVLPYPGGRHPRIGFLEGAIDPQRETKVSVFAPWDDRSYAVVDVPEAIWSNLGLTYLAHTHVPTVWTKQNVTLPALEWQRRADGSLDIERKLPNGIVFAARVVPDRQVVRMELMLTNGTKERLTDLRVQACTMLKAMQGFEQQDNDNKVMQSPYAAARSATGKRWIITAWEPIHRTWANAKCPCLHADPRFPDCDPGQTVRVKGYLWFFEGEDVEAEFKRLDAFRAADKSVPVTGRVLDETGKPAAARIYVRAANGNWLHVRPADKEGSAVPYRKERKPASVEIHAAMSAHPFVFEAAPGKYTIIVERGKEYLTFEKEIEVGAEPVTLDIPLKRFINLGARGWYSGDTHVHRTLGELPTAMQADDLNVALPLLHWVTAAYATPAKKPKGNDEDPGRLIEVDKTHVIWPRNTEYEIFTVGKERHTLGAVFVLGHQTPFDIGVPPVGPVAARARREGALLELDKHNWPWSMAIVPIMKVDLFELTNNHVWRTEFSFKDFGEAAGDYMKIERGPQGFTEKGWLDFGFQNYYALLNSGFRMRPTAGTASGVHPVPLGWGRVYVHLPEGFSYEAWIKGLNAGRSFVTTGPMLFVSVNGQPAGHTFKQADAKPTTYRIKGNAISAAPLARIELVVNGQVVKTLTPANKQVDNGIDNPFDEEVTIEGTSWIAVRCFEKQPGGRERFAHSSPVWIDVPGKPLRPRAAEIDYLIQRVQDQIDRSEKLLPKEAIDEYRAALKAYQAIKEAGTSR